MPLVHPLAVFVSRVAETCLPACVGHSQAELRYVNVKAASGAGNQPPFHTVGSQWLQTDSYSAGI